MGWYREGTVKITANDATVTGTGTKFLENVKVGDEFNAPDGLSYEITNIATNTSLTIMPAYKGASATGQVYQIKPTQGWAREAAQQLAAYVGKLGDAIAKAEGALQAADVGTAAKGTLTTSNQDSTSGRVTRIGDWGWGVGSGVVGSQNILENVVNGIYRSGSADTNAPDANTGAAYFKFGWGETWYSLLYGSPSADKFWMRNVENGRAKAWKELVTVGMFGIGRDGAATDDRFPAASLNEAGVPAGLHYVAPDIGLASDLPAGINTQGVVVHRQAGSGGGQIYVSFLGEALVRGRRSSAYNPWRVLWHSGNTTVDSNGFIKRASP
ncbi:MAG: hypothetical protein ACN6OC_17690, partial [Alcaligenes sp.]